MPAVKTTKKSAGLLLYRRVAAGAIEVFLVHPGGPYWTRKDQGAWSLPKGLVDPGEDPLDTARREFAEETGNAPPDGPFVPLGEVRQAGGKIVTAWGAEGDVDAATIASNTFRMEWPPRSGREQEFPEVDRAAWFTPDEARERILAGQRPFLDRLNEAIGDPGRIDG
jgi:predicted NUDIX family NTP pyrophosphohydrolase